MSSGLPHLNPELAKGLREIADRSVQLGKVASEASEELEVGDSEEMNEDVWPRDSLDRTTSRSVDSAGKGSSDIGWGYSHHYEHYKAAYKPSSLHTFSFPLAEFPSPILSDTQQRFRTRVSPLRPTLSLSKSNSKGSPDGPYTYSFQEETFARRLQRAALERIYHLILHAHYSPATFAQIFKFPLLYSSREQLLAQFRDVLRRGTNEDLEMHWPPFIHFGGAGTLYPEYSTDGEWFDANDVAGYLEEKGIQIDPQASFSEVQMGMEDQWLPSESVMEFDAFTAVSSFADPNTTAVIDAIPVTITGSRSGSSNVSYCPQTPLLNNPHGDGYASLTDVPGDTLDAPIMDLDGCWSSEGANMLNQFETPLASLNPLDFGIAARGPNFPSQGVNIPLAPYIAVSRRNNWQPGKKTKIIDVSKLIDGMSIRTIFVSAYSTNFGSIEITKGSVCLGRTPGFRRKDIDNAFQASLVNIY